MQMVGKHVTRVGVAAVIARESQLLLIRRKRSHGAGSWAVPGGHLEFGENPGDCAIREAREEVGLEVCSPSFAALTNDFFATENRHYITIWMVVDCLADEEINASEDEVAEWGWFDWDNLPAPLFLPLENLINDRNVIFGSLRSIIFPSDK